MIEVKSNGAVLSFLEPWISGRAGMRAELAVGGISDSARVEAEHITHAWNVTRSRAIVPGTSVFRCGPEGFGQHKRQALRLLCCALHLRHALGEPLRVQLHVVHELREGMITAIAGEARALEERRARIRAWSDARCEVSIEAVLAAGMRQAGLSIGLGEADVELGWAELGATIARAQGGAMLRKVS